MLVSPFVVLPTPAYSGGSRYAPAFLPGIDHGLPSCESLRASVFCRQREGFLDPGQRQPSGMTTSVSTGYQAANRYALRFFAGKEKDSLTQGKGSPAGCPPRYPRATCESLRASVFCRERGGFLDPGQRQPSGMPTSVSTGYQAANRYALRFFAGKEADSLVQDKGSPSGCPPRYPQATKLRIATRFGFLQAKRRIP
jgi:hypothetical protein